MPSSQHAFEWWPDPDRGPFRVSIELESIHGRPEVVGITITSHSSPRVGENSNTDDGTGSVPTRLTSDVLRGPLGAVMERLRRRMLQSDDEPGAFQADSHEPVVLAVGALQEESVVPEDGNLDDVSPMPSHARISQALIAQAYKEAHALTNTPTRAVADRFGITYNSAASRIRRARKAGLLPETRQGSAVSTAADDHEA